MGSNCSTAIPFNPNSDAMQRAGGDVWTSRLGRDRCRGGKGRTRRRGADVDRACFLTCRGHVSQAHANVSLTQVLRDDVMLCED